MLSAISKTVGVIVAMWLLTVIIGYLLLKPLRPPRTDAVVPLFDGVVYKRTATSNPRPVQVHLVTIDMRAARPSFLLTPPDRAGEIEQYNARTTSDFVSETGVQLAINAGFFYPFWSNHPLAFYPQQGDPVTPLGVTVSNSRIVHGEDLAEVSVLCITADAFSVHEAVCPSGTEQAVSGNLLYVQASQPMLPDEHQSEPLPRTMLAFNNETQKVWLVVADGRQPLYSRGLTLLEMQAIAVDLGAEGAINLDGGGSSTLVINNNGKPYTLNAPIHTRIPMRQRPVANHLGVSFDP